MTSQEPPLTRREARERERLREAQAASSTPETTTDASAATSAQSAPSPAAPYSAPAPSAFAPPAATPPASAPVAPQPARAGAQPATSGPRPAFSPQPQPLPASPAQQQQHAAAQQQAPAQAPQGSGRAPERTLTRRELRAMLGVSQLDDEDLDEGIDDPVATIGQAQPAGVVGAPPVVSPRPPAAPNTAPAPEASAAQPRRQPAPPPVVAPAANAGHWSQQLQADDDHAEPFDQLLSRGGVSRGVPTTTNALILPVLPDDGKIVSPIAGGDEVIVTGSIDLPRSYGSTGVHPSQVDSTDIDRLFDNVEDATTGVAPVAATKAISTQHAATKQMMAPPKKDGPNVPLVLAVTAGVLALGVVATLIIGAVFRLF